jgi:hypothetical protein
MSPTALADIMPQMTSLSKSGSSEDKHIHGMEGRRPLEAISHGDVVLPGKYSFTFLELRH